MNRTIRSTGAHAVAMLVLATPGLHAQSRDTTPDAGWLTPLATIGSSWEDRARVQQLLGRASADGFLIRSPSSETPGLAGSGRVRWSLLVPEVGGTWNTRIPFSWDDGAMWAGRGTNLQVTAGARIAAGPVSAILAPELTYSQNLPFQTFPGAATSSTFSSPWYAGQRSADLPHRFGDRPLLYVHAGQSTVSMTGRGVVGGVSTENQWWGPGVRNAIVMSNQAAGFPHAFLRTSAPVRTRLGAFEGKWILGGLTESLFFDTIRSNDVRSLSGVAATFRPALDPDLTLGVSRVVYAGVSGPAAVPGRFLDVFTRWASRDPTAADSTRSGGAEQILSVFGRWIFPRDGFEVYAEWARVELPRSFRDLVSEPNHTQGYTLGTQWARPVRREGAFRLQAELTYLEESATFNNRPGRSYYVSSSVPQGYTHRGQLVGAAVGPGGSNQWVGGDYLASGWHFGAFGGRIRWNNDVYYDRPGRLYVAHDVSMLGGLRAGARIWEMYLEAEFEREQRYNYLFQNPEVGVNGEEAVDVPNSTLRLRLTPVRRARR